jgi:hypothetical protein
MGAVAEHPKPNDPVRAALRRSQAVTLRVAGCSYEQIGTQLGVSRQRAHRIVRKALREHRTKTAEEVENLRELEARKIDATEFRAVQVLGKEGVSDETMLKAAQVRLKAIELRAKLFGVLTTAPTVEVNIGPKERAEQALYPIIEGATDEELYSLLATYETIAARNKMPVVDATPPPPEPVRDVEPEPPPPEPVSEPEPVAEPEPTPPPTVPTGGPVVVRVIEDIEEVCPDEDPDDEYE